MASSAKAIQLSDDDVTYYTLPGNTGELQNSAGEITDTVFGQPFASTESGLIGWTISANGLYKGFAGYVAKLLKSGTPTAFTGEAMTLVSGKRYKINDTTKNLWDRTAATIIYDDAADVTNEVESINWLFGEVVFKDTYTVTGAITADGSFLPLTQVARGNTFSLTQTAEVIEETDFETAQGNNGHRVFDYGLKTVALEIGGIYDVTNGNKAQLVSRQELVLEVNPDGGSMSVARGFFRAAEQGQSGDVGALEEESTTFNLNVPNDDITETPFAWRFDPASTLSPAVIKAIEAWEATNIIYARYLPDGATGDQGQVVVQEISLAGGLEVMNEFTVGLQGVDQTTQVV